MSRARNCLRTGPILALSALLVALASGGAAAAGQASPSIVVSPTSVDEPGTVEVTVVGSGWTSDAAILILPCEAPQSGLAQDVDPSLCDADDLTTVNPNGGSFETVVSVVVDPPGLAIAATDSDQTERAVALITVSQPDPDPDPENPDTLPETGANTDLILIAATTLLAAGVLLATQTRVSTRH